MPVLLGLLWAGVPGLARAQSAENVAVIINDWIRPQCAWGITIFKSETFLPRM